MPFGWDNEFPALSAEVPPFSIERHDVTNERFLEFVEAGGYDDERWWPPKTGEWMQTRGHHAPAVLGAADGDGRGSGAACSS